MWGQFYNPVPSGVITVHIGEIQQAWGIRITGVDTTAQIDATSAVTYSENFVGIETRNFSPLTPGWVSFLALAIAYSQTIVLSPSWPPGQYGIANCLGEAGDGPSPLLSTDEDYEYWRYTFKYRAGKHLWHGLGAWKGYEVWELPETIDQTVQVIGGTEAIPKAYDLDCILITIRGLGGTAIGDPGGDGPDNNAKNSWIDPWGFYHIPGRNASGIAYRRYNQPTGSAVLNSQVTTTASDADPGVIRDALGRLWLVFERSGDTLLTYSHDDGATWTTPTTVLSGCKHPVIAIQPPTNGGGGIVIAGFHTATSTLKGVYQAPGATAPGSEQTFKDEAGANISPTEDTFDLVAEYGSAGRWMLVFQRGGAIVRYQCWDETTLTFRQVT